jgi:hypothetical protein
MGYEAVEARLPFLVFYLPIEPVGDVLHGYLWIYGVSPLEGVQSRAEAVVLVIIDVANGFVLVHRIYTLSLDENFIYSLII